MRSESTADLLVLFDLEQRREVTYPDSRREELPRVVRHVSRYGREGTIVYSQLDEQTADTEIEAQLAFFAAFGADLEWKAYSHDRPHDLIERLARHGFAVDEAETVMLLDLLAAPDRIFAPLEHDVRRLSDPADVAIVAAIKEAVWQRPADDLRRRLQDDLVEHPELLSLYAVWVDGQPAAAAWTYFHPGSSFASLWGGSTVERFRGRGLYTALLMARAQEARSRGVRFLTVDAGPMSEPILARWGFRRLTAAYACRWMACEAHA